VLTKGAYHSAVRNVIDVPKTEGNGAVTFSFRYIKQLRWLCDVPLYEGNGDFDVPKCEGNGVFDVPKFEGNGIDVPNLKVTAQLSDVMKTSPVTYAGFHVFVL